MQSSRADFSSLQTQQGLGFDAGAESAGLTSEARLLGGAGVDSAGGQLCSGQMLLVATGECKVSEHLCGKRYHMIMSELCWEEQAAWLHCLRLRLQAVKLLTRKGLGLRRRG